MSGKKKEQKRKRRERRLEKRDSRQELVEWIDEGPSMDLSVLRPFDPPDPGLRSRFGRFLVERIVQPLFGGGAFPGQADPSVRPDALKLMYGNFVFGHPELSGELNRWQFACERGPLARFFPEWGEVAMEDFFWHGSLGLERHPLDWFFDEDGPDCPDAARRQFLRLKEAKFGAFLVGRVRHGTVEITPWDVIEERTCGATRRAISLAIQGARVFRDQQGLIHFGWLAPWAPEQGIDCLTGYGFDFSPGIAPIGLPLVGGLGNLPFLSQAPPWTESRSASRKYAEKWRSRNWSEWLRERLQVPFRTFVSPPRPAALAAWQTVREVIPAPPEFVRELGVYARCEGEADIVVGASTILPTDVCSPNTLVLAEYHAYRSLVGLPPGVSRTVQPDGSFFRN